MNKITKSKVHVLSPGKIVTSEKCESRRHVFSSLSITVKECSVSVWYMFRCGAELIAGN